MPDRPSSEWEKDEKSDAMEYCMTELQSEIPDRDERYAHCVGWWRQHHNEEDGE